MGWLQKLKVNTKEGNSFSFFAFVLYLVKNQLSFFLKKKTDSTDIPVLLATLKWFFINDM